jgi:hypothetical protein
MPHQKSEQPKDSQYKRIPVRLVNFYTLPKEQKCQKIFNTKEYYCYFMIKDRRVIVVTSLCTSDVHKMHSQIVSKMLFSQDHKSFYIVSSSSVMMLCWGVVFAGIQSWRQICR